MIPYHEQIKQVYVELAALSRQEQDLLVTIGEGIVAEGIEATDPDLSAVLSAAASVADAPPNRYQELRTVIADLERIRATIAAQEQAKSASDSLITARYEELGRVGYTAYCDHLSGSDAAGVEDAPKAEAEAQAEAGETLEAVAAPESEEQREAKEAPEAETPKADETPKANETPESNETLESEAQAEAETPQADETAESELKTDSEPKAEANETETPEAEAKAEADETPEAEAQAEADETPEAGAQAEADETPELEAKAEADETPEPEAQPEADETPEPEAKAEADETPELEAKAEADETPEPEAQPEADETPEAEAQPAADETPEAEAQPEADETPEAEAQPAADETPEAEAQPEADETPEAEPKAEADETPEAEPKAASEAESDPRHDELFAEVLALDRLIAERKRALADLEEERKQKGFLGRIGVDRRIKAVTMPEESERTEALVQAGWRVLGSDLADVTNDEGLHELMAELLPARQASADLATELTALTQRREALEARSEALRGDAASLEEALAQARAEGAGAELTRRSLLRSVGQAFTQPGAERPSGANLDAPLAELSAVAAARDERLNRVQVLKLEAQLTGLTGEKAALQKQREQMLAAVKTVEARLSILNWNHLLLEDLMTSLAPPSRPPPKIAALGPAPQNGSLPAPTAIVALEARNATEERLPITLFVGDGLSFGAGERDLVLEGDPALHGAVRLSPKGVCIADWSKASATTISGAAVTKGTWHVLPHTGSSIVLGGGAVSFDATPIRALNTSEPPCGLVLRRADPPAWYVLIKARAAVTWTPAGDLAFQAPNHPRSSFELGLDPTTNALRVAGRPDKPVVIKQDGAATDKPVLLDASTTIEGPQGGVLALV